MTKHQIQHVLKSEVKTDMTPAVFKELATVVAEIRSSFVK